MTTTPTILKLCEALWSLPIAVSKVRAQDASPKAPPKSSIDVTFRSLGVLLDGVSVGTLVGTARKAMHGLDSHHASLLTTERFDESELESLGERLRVIANWGESREPLTPEKLSDFSATAVAASELADRISATPLALVSSGDGETVVATSNPVPPTKSGSSSLADDAWMTYPDLADRFGLNADTLRQRLKSFQRSNDADWKEVTDRKPREPRFLYRVGAVRHILDAMIASSKPPAE